MPNFTSIEVSKMFLTRGNPTEEHDPVGDVYNVRLKVEPPPNDDFKLNNCRAGCQLYVYAKNHNDDDGSCSGPIGEHNNLLDVSTPCTKDQSQGPGITVILARAKCNMDEGQMATKAIINHLL